MISLDVEFKIVWVYFKGIAIIAIVLEEFSMVLIFRFLILSFSRFWFYSLFFLLLTVACNQTDSSRDTFFHEKLSLADSLSHIQPETADSLFRFILRHPGVSDSRIRIRANLGVASGFSNGGRIDSSRFYLDVAFKEAIRVQDTMMILRCYLQSGNLYIDPGDFNKAETEFILGLNYAKKVKNTAYQEKFLLSLGTIKMEKGDYPGAMKIYMLGLKMAVDQQNRVSEAYALEQIGLTMAKTNEFEEAIQYLQQAVSIRQSLNMQRELAGALQNLGIVFRRAGMPDSSMNLYKKALSVYAQLGDSGKMIMVRYNIGVVLKNERRFEEARREMEEVLSTSKKLKILQGQMYAYTSLADIYHKTGLVPMALSSIDSAIHISGLINQRSNAAAFYERKSNILVSVNKYQEAYRNLMKVKVLNDSLLSAEKQKEVAKLKLAFETEKKEVQINFLKVDNQYKTTRIRLMTILLISGILVTGLVLLLIWYRMKRLRLHKELAEEQNLRMEEARKREKLELEQLELKTKMQEQELVYRTLVEADITQLNRSVKEKLLPFRMKMSRKTDQEGFLQAIQELTRESHRDPMAQFDALFKELHPGFYEKLLTEFSSLTSSELQICALIRLNFSSKDIARLLSLSVATIETSRSHIRKKINLDAKDNLSSFLMTK